MQNAGDEYACLWMCFVPGFVRACPCIYSVCRWLCPQNVCTVCVCRGVCKGVSVYDDGEAGLLSFNTVLPGHWAICKCTELTAEAQSSLVHPPTSSTSPSVPPTVWLSCLIDSSCCPMKQRHRHKYGPGRLSRSWDDQLTISWDQGVRELRASMLTSLSWLVISDSIMLLPL